MKDIKDTPAYVPPTDEDMRLIINEMQKEPIYLKGIGYDSLSELMNAPAEELLEVAIANYNGKDMSVDFLVRLGFSLAHKDGWEHIAPAWLKKYRDEFPNGRMAFKMIHE